MRTGLLLAGATLCGFVTTGLAQALDSSSGCAAASTQTITATITATVFDPAGSGIASFASPTATISSLSTFTSFSTLTSYSTLTNFITVYPSTTATSLDPVANDDSSAYYYADINGSTSWLNGISPASTYLSLITSTIQVTVYPTAVDPSTTAMTVLNTQTLSIMPPASAASAAFDPAVSASVSSVTSYLSQEITSVGTSYMTSGNSESGAVSPGPGPFGWNTSSSMTNDGPYQTDPSRGTAVTEVTITGGPVTITRSVLHAPSSATLQLVTAAGFSSNATRTSPVGFNATDLQSSVLGTGIGSGFADPWGMAATDSQLIGQSGTAAFSGSRVLSGMAPFDLTAISLVSAVGFSSSGLSYANQTASSDPTASQYYINSLSTSAPLPGGLFASPSPSQTMSNMDVSSVSTISIVDATSSFQTMVTVDASSISTVAIIESSSLSILNTTTNGSFISLSAFPSTTPSIPSVLGWGMTGSGSSSNQSFGVRPTGLSSSVSQASNMSIIAPAPSPSKTILVSRATSSTLSRVFTNVTSGSMPTPSVCGEHGDFVLTWGDVPTFNPTEPITDPSDAPPVFNPYHHLYFSNGFVYMPPPIVPFSPISSPRLVMFLTNETGPSNNEGAGGQLPGEIGAGDRASNSAFWFNAYSAYLGCDNEGPDECTMQVSGYVWQGSQEVLAYRHNATLPPCLGFQNCKLQQVKFPKSMVGLSGVQIQAFVGGEQRMWYMDDLALGWYNNTCAAGLVRIRSD